jgi:hypothetical protein
MTLSHVCLIYLKNFKNELISFTFFASHLFLSEEFNVFIGGFGEAKIMDKTKDGKLYESNLAKDLKYKLFIQFIYFLLFVLIICLN